jgi:hypothetical protein
VGRVFSAKDGCAGLVDSTLHCGSDAAAIATGVDANWQSKHGVELSAV